MPSLIGGEGTTGWWVGKGYGYACVWGGVWIYPWATRSTSQVGSRQIAGGGIGVGVGQGVWARWVGV